MLGVEWLRTLSPILWDFTLMIRKYSLLGHTILLHGLSPTDLSMEEGHQFFKSSMSRNKGLWLHMLSPAVESANSVLLSSISAVLSEFGSVFDEPKGLPPPRSHDHHIRLKGSQPNSVRPYRYSYFQKTEIEKIVKELLATRIIKPSQSPFSSSVLLVCKADGSWRLYVDYKALNQETIKDKFPI